MAQKPQVWLQHRIDSLPFVFDASSLGFYLSSVVKQQSHGVGVTQVSVDAQKRGVVEDIATRVHISPAYNQQSAHLDRWRARSSITQSLCVSKYVCVIVSVCGGVLP